MDQVERQGRPGGENTVEHDLGGNLHALPRGYFDSGRVTNARAPIQISIASPTIGNIST